MDARDSGTAFDLRYYVREKLIEFLQREYPDSLPKIRAELHSLPSREPAQEIGAMHN